MAETLRVAFAPFGFAVALTAFALACLVASVSDYCREGGVRRFYGMWLTFAATLLLARVWLEASRG